MRVVRVIRYNVRVVTVVWLNAILRRDSFSKIAWLRDIRVIRVAWLRVIRVIKEAWLRVISVIRVELYKRNQGRIVKA